MSALELVPQGWFSWDFVVLQNGSPIAEIDISSWREKGALIIGDSRYTVCREGIMSCSFVLELNGTQVAHAEKRALVRLFTVQHEGKTYTLKAAAPFGRRFVLLENDKEIGSIAPAGFFTRKATVELPDELPLPIKVFLLWLTVILWKRESEAATSIAATGG